MKIKLLAHKVRLLSQRGAAQVAASSQASTERSGASSRTCVADKCIDKWSFLPCLASRDEPCGALDLLVTTQVSSWQETLG